MPLTKSGDKVLKQMKQQYGAKKGKKVFHRSINKGVAGSDKWHTYSSAETKGGMKMARRKKKRGKGKISHAPAMGGRKKYGKKGLQKMAAKDKKKKGKKLRKMQYGGIVRRPTRVLLGERRPETVLPIADEITRRELTRTRQAQRARGGL